jgi:pSer/pThr/pTyr-binding forkhead associated (FHA) protein
MRCGQCGTENPGEALFCMACGTRFAASSAPPPVVGIAGPAALIGRNSFRLVFVHHDGTDGITYPLYGEQIDIGRTEGDLLFEDTHLSPRHARITSTPAGQVLTGLDTRNGVYVRLRASVEVKDGDFFLVGRQVLRFELVPESEKDLRPAVHHNVMQFGTYAAPAWGRFRQIGPTGVSHDVFHFSRDTVVIGREHVDLVFSDDQFMSRRHAQLSRRGSNVSLEDLGSSNGTFVRLTGEHLLQPGDVIRLGNVLLRFER